MKLKIKNKKRFIIVCIILLIILLTIIITAINLNNKKNKNITNTNNTLSEEAFTRTSQNGQKTNISSKIKEKKTVENLEFSDIKITSLNNQTTVTGKVTNPTSKNISGFYFKLSALDENGTVIAESEGLLDSIIKSGSSITFNASTSKDFANCYDIQITKIKDAD